MGWGSEGCSAPPQSLTPPVPHSPHVDPRPSILARLYVVLVLLALVPVAVAVQLGRIYVAEGGELREVGVRQATGEMAVPALRGTIRDRAGRTLAVNTARFEVALDPTVRGFDAAAPELYATLGRLTGRPASEFERLVRNRTSRQYVLLLSSLDERSKEVLEEKQVPGLLLTPRFARRYTYGAIGAHVLGHVDTDLRGISGVELLLDEALRGTPGSIPVQRDRRGIVRVAVDGPSQRPVHGEEVTLTLDLVLQSILQEELVRGTRETGATWGTAVAIDPHTGAILALANAPDYDPNRPGAFPESHRRNYAITDQIEPGSTFKLVTAIAALEAGVAAMTDSVDTGSGYAVFGGRAMRDTQAHGTITFAEAMARSSNIAHARLAQRLDDGQFYRTARALGFGQATLVDLPGEESGVLHRPDRWDGTTKTSMAIGYAVTATPLQLVTAYASLGNGGLLVRPHLVAERRDLATGEVRWRAPVDSVRRAYSRATADTLLPVFERVVSTEGTARRAIVDGVRIAGKTGTARVAQGGRYGAGYRATFVGLFPAERPEVAMIVVLHQPQTGIGGGAVAAPIFARIAERWAGVMPALAGHRASADSLPALRAVPVPDVAGLPQRVAASRLHAAGLMPLTDGRRDARAWAPVVRQTPEPASTLPPGRVVRLAADRETTEAAVMPDVRGLPARRAAAWLGHLGASVRLDGAGIVTQQTPAPGEPLPSEALLSTR